MWLLVITLHLLVTVYGHQAYSERTIRLEYPTQFTCQEAEDRIDPSELLASANRLYEARHELKYLRSFRTDCEPGTATPDDSLGHYNRVQRS